MAVVPYTKKKAAPKSDVMLHESKESNGGSVMVTEKEKALDQALDLIERSFGKGSIMRFGQAGSKFAMDSCSEISKTTSLGRSLHASSVRQSASARKFGS